MTDFGNYLTNISFASLSNQIKFVDLVKYYYKQSFSQLASATTSNGKASVKNLTYQLLYSLTILERFSPRWIILSLSTNLLVLIAAAKDVILYDYKFKI